MKVASEDKKQSNFCIRTSVPFTTSSEKVNVVNSALITTSCFLDLVQIWVICVCWSTHAPVYLLIGVPTADQRHRSRNIEDSSYVKKMLHFWSTDATCNQFFIIWKFTTFCEENMQLVIPQSGYISRFEPFSSLIRVSGWPVGLSFHILVCVLQRLQFFHLFRDLYIEGEMWNAKLTETQIFRELSIEIESSLFNYRALYFNYWAL